MESAAKLRCCASCEWIFNVGVTCPRCGFGSYGAYYVYGKACYRYAKTQVPWKRRIIDHVEKRLTIFIRRHTDGE